MVRCTRTNLSKTEINEGSKCEVFKLWMAVGMTLRVVPNLLIMLNLRRLWVNWRGHVTDSKTHFLPSANCPWLDSCHAT